MRTTQKKCYTESVKRKGEQNMKKFVIIERVGTYEKKGRKIIIDGTVKETKIFTESNDWDDIFTTYKELPISEYRDSTWTWHSYSLEYRKDARKMLKH